jgi:GGDEF domain-containing protein
VKYARFEWLMIGVGAIAIAGMTAILYATGNGSYEGVVTQVLLFAVLAGAVHWGRNGGFVAAVGASVAGIALHAPELLSDGLTPALLRLILIQLAVYGLVGILGGEAAGRMKYLVAGMEDDANVDAETHVYTGRFLGGLLGENLFLHDRYGTPFSLVTITLSPTLTAQLSDRKRMMLLRSVADRVRNTVRLVDDVGRLEDGSFVLVLPQTGRDGGAVAAERVRAEVAELLGATDGAVVARVLSVPDDTAGIDALRERIEAAVA